MSMRALDLNKEFPRSPYAELAGIPWLPRMIDKVRALNASTLGEYSPFPCGGDRNFLKTMGIAADELKPVIDGGATDDAIAAWVKSHAAPGWEDRLIEYRDKATQPVTGDRAEYLQEAIAKISAARPELNFSSVRNFNQLICVEEGYLLPTL